MKEIVVYPHPILRKKAEEVPLIDGEVRDIISEMFETMKEGDGIGLAAPQIGISRRIIVVSVDEKGFHKFALVNPRIVFFSKEKSIMEEGCLSIPGIRAEVKRPQSIVVEGFTRSGRAVRVEASGLLARVFQHEIDHLDGVLFIDKVVKAERNRVEKELKELFSDSTVSG
ncbi:MAG: peptide deformylase [Spirochaetes bacterium]|nr:MAG: peptide deformylase [Spirochaetota bacterium]